MKVTLQEIQDSIKKVLYHQFEGTQVTVCVIVLDNDFTAVGTSACVDPAEFNRAMGETIAYKAAESDAWKLLGFRLAEKMAAQREG